MKTRLHLIIAILCFAFTGLKAQQTDYSVEANISYHFTKYIAWPDQSLRQNFEIGIYGSERVFDIFSNAMNGRMAAGKPIVVRRISTTDEARTCNILFITADEPRLISRINSRLPDHHILLLTSREGMGSQGACINFAVQDEKLQLEINKKNITDHQLKIATELLSLGVRVD